MNEYKAAIISVDLNGCGLEEYPPLKLKMNCDKQAGKVSVKCKVSNYLQLSNTFCSHVNIRHELNIANQTSFVCKQIGAEYSSK